MILWSKSPSSAFIHQLYSISPIFYFRTFYNGFFLVLVSEQQLDLYDVGLQKICWIGGLWNLFKNRYLQQLSNFSWGKVQKANRQLKYFAQHVPKTGCWKRNANLMFCQTFPANIHDVCQDNQKKNHLFFIVRLCCLLFVEQFSKDLPCAWIYSWIRQMVFYKLVQPCQI